MSKSIRVLVADDSAFMRHMIVEKLLNEPDMTVVGTARDGMEAVVKVRELDPDVVTMDVSMPRMDGMEALKEIMRDYPRPVIMLSGVTTEGAEATTRALELGAVDFVTKPSGSVSLDLFKVKEELLAKIRQAKQVRLRPRLLGAADTPVHPTQGKSESHRLGHQECVVVIGTSTGGPKALHRVLPFLPQDLLAAILVVQHMPAGFTAYMATHLDKASNIPVQEAQEGQEIEGGMALVAPGDYHMLIDKNGMIALEQGPRVHGVRPAVDVTLECAAKVFGPRTVAVILTGMGVDGTRGVTAVRQAGGMALVEDESTCVVYGMPRSVVQAGQADVVVPLDQMAKQIVRIVSGGR